MAVSSPISVACIVNEGACCPALPTPALHSDLNRESFPKSLTLFLASLEAEKSLLLHQRYGPAPRQAKKLQKLASVLI